MANITYVGTGANITWGSNTVSGPNGFGVVISASNDHTGETIPVLSNLGIPDGFVIVPGLTHATISAYAAAGTAPNIGDVANVGGANVYVESLKTDWEQKNIKKISLTGKALP